MTTNVECQGSGPRLLRFGSPLSSDSCCWGTHFRFLAVEHRAGFVHYVALPNSSLAYSVARSLVSKSSLIESKNQRSVAGTSLGRGRPKQLRAEASVHL